MARHRDLAAASAPNVPEEDAAPPQLTTALATATVSLLAIVLTGWSAGAPRAQQVQTGIVKWFNHPPQPLAAVLAAANPLLRPIPLIILGILFVAWVVITARRPSDRRELVRAGLVTLVVAELVAQTAKLVANQPRPLAVIPGLDNHGYPIEPHGNAYPSAHTAVVVGLVAGLWPWLRWPQRVVGLIVAVLVAFNRLYIGAHWPIDILGGAAVGMLAASVGWLIAARWPMHRQSGSPS